MGDKIWTGGIYLKDEGGYKIVLKSLNHYKNRLKTLDNSPELRDSAAMFASVLNQQARRVVPQIDEMIKKIQDGLTDSKSINMIQKDDVSFLEKALTCYQSDIHKAEDTGYEYFVNLVGDRVKARRDLTDIKIALEKINQYC